MLKITLNGKEVEFSGSNLEDLCIEFSLAKNGIAIELNREIVSRTSYAQTKLQEGDIIEVVQFVGGG